jgi:hypothetical protein
VLVRLPSFRLTTTTGGRRWIFALAGIALALALGCRAPRPPDSTGEPATRARTEFTDRIENFFEHDPLVPGKPSRFLIHLTDLSDGSPVEKADVVLTVRPAGGGGPDTVTKAKVARVTGIYVAEVTAPSRGSHTIEFHVKNPKLDERMTLADFAAQ